ncbi:hypothetical protein IJD44_02830 [bacterium]|nr:hypothetical protein [bacterium]
MNLTSDIMLSHPLWERADNELCDKDSIGLFGRLVDVYLVACAIGVKADISITEIKEPLIPNKSIGRNTYLSQTNTDLHETLDFLLQNALINSKTINYDVEERLKMAFDPDYNVPKFIPAAFLTGFANYGIEKIFETIDSSSPLVAIDELNIFLNDLVDSDYDDILRKITLEEVLE